MTRASTFSSISAQAVGRVAGSVTCSINTQSIWLSRVVGMVLGGAFVFGLSGATSLVFASDAIRAVESRANPYNRTDVRDAKSGDAVEWLERICRAGRENPYTGVYVHSTADNSASTRVTHLVDKQGVEHEKIESLDGPMMEIIRRNDEMYSYQPQEKVVLIDRRASGRFFPSLVTGDPKKIAENYRVKMGPKDRIAGHDCQWIILEPKDSMRYMQKLCAELGTGLLLRAKTFNDRNQLLEQFVFTQLDLSRSVTKQSLKSKFEQSIGWRRDYSVPPSAPQKDVETGWLVSNLPAGFKKVMEMMRSQPGRPQPLAHLVVSDGLSHVSVFVEPAQSSGRVNGGGASDDSPTTFAVRSVADHQVTVMGDVPFAAVQAIADGVTRRAR
jgi:sigma-E factor negative regulatory protein RseB